MKETFDNNNIKFYVLVDGLSRIDYDTLHGIDLVSFCNQCKTTSIEIRGIRNIEIPDSHGHDYAQISSFLISSDTEEITIEDAMKEYIKNNYDIFSNVKKIHSLCFLQRYCLNYEDVKKLINSNN